MELAIRGFKLTGKIIFGEERTDQGPVLCSGDEVGAGEGPRVDVALEPIECINSLADGHGNAISAIALGEKGTFKHIPEKHMKKIAVGPESADVIDLNLSVFDNLVRIAETKRIYVEDLTVSIIDRDRHRELIEKVRQAGARIELIRDGDLAAAIAAALPGTGVDVLMGIGGTKQGIIAAAALACIGGGFQAQVLPDGTFDAEHVPDEYGKIYQASDLVGGENVMFAATGVTHNNFLEGIMFRPGGAVTHSAVFRSKSGTLRFLKTEHFFDKTPDYT